MEVFLLKLEQDHTVAENKYLHLSTRRTLRALYLKYTREMEGNFNNPTHCLLRSKHFRCNSRAVYALVRLMSYPNPPFTNRRQFIMIDSP